MATVTSLTADRMIAIENASVVNGAVDTNGDLLLETHGGNIYNAGHVRGADATALLGVSNTDTVDLTLSGLGSLSDPWDLSADIKALPNSIILTGILEPSYSSGRAKVKIGGSLSSEAYAWATPYIPESSRIVNLIKMADTYLILGQNEDTYYPLEINNSHFYSYNRRSLEVNYSSEYRAVQLSSGLVVLTGLLSTYSSATTATPIAILPDHLRPEYDLIFPIELSSTAGSIRVNADGVIRVQANMPATGGFIPLDGIKFWPKNTVSWTEIGTSGSSFGSNFEAHAPETYGPPAFYIDQYNFCWFRGVLRCKTTTSVTNTPYVNVPYNPYLVQMQMLRSNDNAASGRFTSGVLQWQTGNNGAVGSWHTLAGVLGSPNTSAACPWLNMNAFANSWVVFDSAHSVPAYGLREDGLRLTKGLVKSGSAGLLSVLPSREFAPRRGRIILGGAANGPSRLRVDVHQENPTLYLGGGAATTWTSLEGLSWIP